MRIYPEVKISIGLVIAFMLVVTGTGFAYTNSISAIEHGKSVEKGLELLAALESLLQVVKTNQRASFSYATTGNTKSLKKYEETAKSIGPHLQFIKELASTDKRRYILLTNLETQVRVLSNKLFAVVDQRKTKNNNFEITNSLRDSIDNRYELIRDRVLFIESEEKALLEHRITLYEKETEKLFNSYAMLGGMVGVFFLFLIWTLIKYVRTTRQIQEAEQRISDAIFKHAPIGIMILKEDLSVLSVNPEVRNYIKNEEVLGESVLNLIPDFPPEAIDYLDSIVEGHDLSQEAQELKEVRVFSEKFFDFIFWPIIENQSLKGIIVVLVDVSNNVALNRQKELLLNTFTHDLKNPLVGNQYLVKAISKNNNQLLEKDKEILDQLAQGNEDLLLMVNNILNIAKLQSQDMVLTNSEFSIASVLNEAIESLESFTRTKEVSIETSLPDSDVVLNADKTITKHLVINLLTNAIKFSDTGGIVHLSLSDEENHATIEVQDEGPGISDADQQSLFTAAKQGEVGKRIPGGSGIGLYLCAQIVDALGGTIECRSKLDKGATFLVKLPKSRIEQSESSLVKT